MFALIFAACLLLPPQENASNSETTNTVVSLRLVAFGPSYAKQHVDMFRPSNWYTEIKDDAYFKPDAELIQEIDKGLGEFLANVATNDPDAKEFEHFTDGINRIRSIRHAYCGQFMGATTNDNEKIIICMYSLVRNVDEFQKLTTVPYVADGDGENFSFYYNTTNRKTSDFHIEGGFAGPFGTSK